MCLFDQPPDLRLRMKRASVAIARAVSIKLSTAPLEELAAGTDMVASGVGGGIGVSGGTGVAEGDELPPLFGENVPRSSSL